MCKAGYRVYTVKAKRMKRFTTDEDHFILVNYQHLPMKTISRLLGRSDATAGQRLRRLGFEVPADKTVLFKRIGQFQKGMIPANKGRKQSEWLTPEGIKQSKKTRFKKGQKPHNTISGKGHIRKRKGNSGKNYLYIKISDARWELYHHHVWKQYHGKIPAGKIISFIDGDQMNCSITNLKIITRQENMNRNSVQRFPETIRKAIHTIGVLHRKINQYEKQTNRP